MLLSNKWVAKETKEEIKKYLETNENENTRFKACGMQKSSFKRAVYSNTSLAQKKKKQTNLKFKKDLTSPLKELEIEELINPKLVKERNNEGQGRKK